MKHQWIYKFFSAILIVMLVLMALPVKPAYADVVILNSWTNIASTGASGNNATINAGNLTVSAGTNRLFVAAVCMELSGSNFITSLDMTLGSATLTEIDTTTGMNTEKCYMGYLLDSQIPSGSNALTVAYDIGGTTTTVTGAHVYWASFSGVSQTDPINDSDQQSNGAANVNFNSTISYLDNGITFYVAANIGSPATMTAPTGFSQVLATTTNGHSSFIGSITTAPHSANGSYPGSTTVNFGGTTGARSSLVVASLTPVYTITVTTGANGTITPAGPAVSVNPGDDEDFVIAPNANHIVADVLVDGVSQGRINYYEFVNVLTNHTISATFDGGWYAPSANVNGTGGAAFSNPGNAYSSDNARANGGNNDNVTYSTFNIPAIPGGATINGIEVALEGNDNGRTVTVAISEDGGVTYAPTSNTVDFTTTDSTIIVGGPTNLWGGTWDNTSFTNTDFRVRLTSQTGGGGATVNIDQLQVKVYYTVTPTLSINNSPVTYNGSPQAANVTCSSGGTVSNILYNGSGTVPTNAGTYAVTADCAAVPGFTSLTNASAGNFVIDQATPTASITNSPVTYNGSAQTALVECLGGGTATLASGGTGTNAGLYPATVDCAASANYTAATGLAAGNFTINPIPASVTPNTANKDYGFLDPPFTGILSGFVPADNVTATYSRTAGETVAGSPYIISATLSPVGVLSNYNITYNTANFTINSIPVVPSITANNKEYDGNTTATFTCSLTNILPGDDVTCSGTANFDNKNVGTDKTVTATGITLGGADATNYTLSTNSATDLANITQRDLNVTATGINKVYDGNTNATVTLNDDRVGGDVLTLSYTSASFADPNVGNGILVSVSGISISGGADAGNYNLVNNTTTTNADITIASQTITVTTSAPASAANGSNFDVAATASSGLPVTITTSGSCSGGDTDGDATITMTSGTGTCSVFYNQAGDSNYTPAPQVQEDVNATESPIFTSVNTTTFDFGFIDTFNLTATGNPSTMSITMTGEPAGVTLTDNGNGTATLNYDGTTSPGIYTIIFTANNGVLPNGTQTFTLTIRNGPTVSTVNSSPDTGNGSVSENENISTTLGITQFTVEFDRDVYDPSGDTDPDDVTNPDNYLLVRSATGTFSTASCSGGLVAPDVQISVDSVTYNNGGGSGPFVATLSVNSGLPLNVAGFYRLFVCGTTSIVDASNPLLALAGNGSAPGTDFIRNFRITAPATGGGGGGGGGTASTTTNLTGVLIPVTGFAPSQVTALPAQPMEKEYAVSPLTLKIPSLGVNLPIVGVDFDENEWDVTWLGNNAGYLEGSAYPTWNGNSILTSHVTDPNGKPGPFAYVNELRHGEKIYIHNNGFIYVYEVRQNQLILPTSIKTLFKSEEDAWLTLVTCENFDEETNTFTHRRMIRAVLISIIPEK